MKQCQANTKRVAGPEGQDPWQSVLPEKTPGPQGRRRRRNTPIVICAHGWSGKEPTQGYMYAAHTQAQGSASSAVHSVFFKHQLASLFKKYASRTSVSGFHFFSHSGHDGPIFADGQLSLAEIDALSKLKGTTNARAVFRGCNAGLGWFCGAFAKSQGVVTEGASGYTYFSRRKDQFVPADNPDSIPIYLDAFPGMENLLVQEYGYKNDNFVEQFAKKALMLPEWWKQQHGGARPKPLVRYTRRGELEAGP